VPPDAGYRGLENQLYRVEVHTGGPLGTANFKWSRDNATVASRVTHINPARNRITVESIGRDDVLRFNDGDWAEVTDDWLELNNLPGELHRISVAGGVDESARTLTFDTALTAGLFPVDGQQATDALRNTRVRRWDQSGQIRREDGTALENLDDAGSSGAIEIRAAGTRLFLEHGILVDFDLVPAGGAATGEFKSGDYWVFAARSTDASLELLKQAGHRLYPFSNGTTDMVSAVLEHARIDQFFEDVISVDSLQTFKPDPEVYHHVVEIADVAPENCWLVSSNGFDVIGAVSAGMKAAWLKRFDGVVFDPWEFEPTQVIRSLDELPEQIS